MRKIKLKDVCKFIDYRGKTPKKTTSGIPLVTAQIIKNGFIQEPQEFISQEIYNAHMRRGIPKKGDVVLTTEAPLGEVAQIRTDERLAFAQRVIILQADEKILHNAYLLYALKYKPFKDRILGKASGTTVFGIRASELKEVELEVPSLETQKKIAVVLSVLDDKIALNKKINTTLEDMVKTLYDYWFVQFDFPDENGKPYKTSGGKMIYSSELGRDIPTDWEVKKLADMANIFDSRRIPLSNSERASMKGDIPYYGATGIVDYVNKSIFDGVYLLVAEDGSVETNSGNLVLQYIWGKSWVNNHAHILQGIENCSTEYLYLALQKIKTKQLMTGSIQKKITQDKLLGTKLICPIDKSILRMFQKIISPVFTEYKLRTDASRRLAELRDWLLPMLMNGQIKF